jgi:hypothetical protein
VSDLLALARSGLSGETSELSEISPPQRRSGFSGETSELSEQSPLADPLPSPSSLLSHPNRVSLRRKRRRKRIPRVPCFTCGLSPTGTYEDGSPRYDHGHDPVTGETWWAPSEVASARTCPACQHEHPAGTTCRQCEACQALDQTAIAARSSLT